MKLTKAQIKEIKGEVVHDGVPVRFRDSKDTWGYLDIETGEHQGIKDFFKMGSFYTNFTEETAYKIALWLNCEVVFYEQKKEKS